MPSTIAAMMRGDRKARGAEQADVPFALGLTLTKIPGQHVVAQSPASTEKSAGARFSLRRKGPYVVAVANSCGRKEAPAIFLFSTLVRFADQIASFGKGAVLDAPCGYGRNAVAFSARGCMVVGVDNDQRRLVGLEQVKTAYIAQRVSPGVSPGEIVTICADLTAEWWPFAPSSFSAIICVHFAMINLVPCFISSLQVGGYIYAETFGGQGQNFRELPKAGQLRELFSKQLEFKYYKERTVGPTEFDSVSASLFAQKR